MGPLGLGIQRSLAGVRKAKNPGRSSAHQAPPTWLPLASLASKWKSLRHAKGQVLKSVRGKRVARRQNRSAPKREYVIGPRTSVIR